MKIIYQADAAIRSIHKCFKNYIHFAFKARKKVRTY